MIKIIDNLNIKTEPHYQLVYNYMIGDADGYTTQKIDYDINDPYLERYCKLLMEMKPINGYLGVRLSEDRIYKLYIEGKLPKDDYDFLSAIMFNDYGYMGKYATYEAIENPFKIDFKVFDKYSEGVMSKIEYSYLSLEKLELNYINEYFEVFKTEFVDE